MQRPYCGRRFTQAPSPTSAVKKSKVPASGGTAGSAVVEACATRLKAAVDEQRDACKRGPRGKPYPEDGGEDWVMDMDIEATIPPEMGVTDGEANGLETNQADGVEAVDNPELDAPGEGSCARATTGPPTAGR